MVCHSVCKSSEKANNKNIYLVLVVSGLFLYRATLYRARHGFNFCFDFHVQMLAFVLVKRRTGVQVLSFEIPRSGRKKYP